MQKLSMLWQEKNNMLQLILKYTKRMFITLGALIALFIIAYMLFVGYYPTFGGDISEKRQQLYTTSKQYKEGKFVNTKDVPQDPSFSDMMTMTRKFFFTKVPNTRPQKSIPVHKFDSSALHNNIEEDRLIWFGHSTFLLQSGHYNVLIDPMLGKVPAPHPLLGGERFSKELPITIAQLPKIDAVLISHDHYDHLDYESIQQLKDKVTHFYTPLGVGVHLEAWGVPQERITELDWWQQVNFETFNFVCTPAQHFSGRKLSNGQSTLWSSWVIQTPESKIFFSGDSGYSTHFKEIGEKYGPFDIALMECGQYNEMWPDIHMFPEETAQAGIDVNAKKMMPIHWGGFKLALHSWTEPIERVISKSTMLGLPIMVPQIGTPIKIKQDASPLVKWWQ
ncbi:MBL fold metallo-hydrolase [Aquimarina rhabdastrellae]